MYTFHSPMLAGAARTLYTYSYQALDYLYQLKITYRIEGYTWQQRIHP